MRQIFNILLVGSLFLIASCKNQETTPPPTASGEPPVLVVSPPAGATAENQSPADNTPRRTRAFISPEGQPVFENELVAFRSYGPGFSLDIFGKTEAGRALLLGRYLHMEQPYILDYHKFNPEGLDIMANGKSPGLGQMFLYFRGKRYTASPRAIKWEVARDTPLASAVRGTAQIDLPGEWVKVIRTYELTADNRLVRDTLIIQGPPEVTEKLLVGIGLRNFKNDTFTLEEKLGYACVSGQGSEDRVREIGLGLVFNPMLFIRTDRFTTPLPPGTPVGTLPDNGYIVVLQPIKIPGGLMLQDLLGFYWNLDHTLRTQAEFETFLRQQAATFNQ